MPRPSEAKKSVNSLTWARSSTCGPTSTPSTSSTTTTGTNTLRSPAMADSVAASAAVATITRNDPVSTLSVVTANRNPVIAATLSGSTGERRLTPRG